VKNSKDSLQWSVICPSYTRGKGYRLPLFGGQRDGFVFAITVFSGQLSVFSYEFQAGEGKKLKTNSEKFKR
jgi:hypothetical protein